MNWFENLGYRIGDLATDSNGNVHWVFNYPISSPAVQLGNVTLEASNGAVMAYVRYDLQGNITAAKAWHNGETLPSNTINQIAINAADEIFMMGTWGGVLNFEDIELTSDIAASTGGLLWLAKFNANTDLLWLSRSYVNTNASGNVSAAFQYMDVASDGGIFVASEVTNHTGFTLGEGDKAKTFNNQVDGFIAKYESNGALGWAQELDCLQQNCDFHLRSLTSIGDDQAIVTGAFSHELDLGNSSLTSVVPSAIQFPNIYILKVDGRLMTSNQDVWIEPNTFKIAPNPAKDFVHIKLNNEFINGQIELFDLNGKRLMKTALENNRLNVGSIPNGSYIITDVTHPKN